MTSQVPSATVAASAAVNSARMIRLRRAVPLVPYKLVNVLTCLTAKLDAYGRNVGRPLTAPELERFLPWTADPDDLRTWAQHLGPG